MLTFEQPLLLLLLLPVGILVYLAWRRMSLPFPRAQRLLILGCRLLLFTLVICALSGVAVAQPISRQAVVFVGDISASTGPQRAFIEQWITSAIQHKHTGDSVGIVAVGRNALVEQSVQSQIDFSHFESTPDTNYTDLAAGLRLAAAILPTDSLRRIVLLSDGQQNLEDALQEAQLLQQEGIRLDIVPLPASTGPEARIDGLSTPTELRSNERFVLHLKLFSNVVQQATLRLYLDQTLLTEQKISLVGGEQELTFPLLAPPPGFHTFRMTLEAPQDTLLENNQAAAFVNVQGPPQVLVIEGTPGEGHNIVAALQATQINVKVGTAGDVPTTLDGLAAYSTVVLVDVPAISLGTTRMQILQAFVRDLGRGLVVSGGENSYGVGGYANTPLEETLPMTMDIPQHKDTPSIAVVLIIDSLESQNEINISKEAAKGVVSLLTPRDQVGISDATGNLVIPMQYVTDRTKIDASIDRMDPNDPGSYLPDFINAENVLVHTNAKIKHVILLGDGDTQESAALQQQLFKMANEPGTHISVSTVATNAGLGAGPFGAGGLALMRQIATLGKGRFYQADDPTAIPKILLQETQQAARRAVITERFLPAIVGSHPILTGLGALPQLTGYVATTPKPAAQLVLVSHLDDPVLAVWQYGLGRVAAWTSDALGEWTADWLQWSSAARWWANLVTWTLPTPDSALNVNVNVVGGTAHTTVDIPPGTPGAQVNPGGSQQVQIRIITPDLAQESVTLQPTAPQRWEGNFPALQVGAYLLQVKWQGLANKQGATSQLVTNTGLIVPYSPEYRTMGTDVAFLKLLAQAGGGTILPSNGYAGGSQAFASNIAPVFVAQPITFWLFAIAALLLPIDIAARRLSSLEFLLLAFQWLMGLFKRRAPTLATSVSQPTGTSIDSTLGSLRIRRQERRSQVQIAPTKKSVSAGTNPQSVPPPWTPSAQETSKGTLTPARNTKPQPSADSMASKLLEAKRNRERAK